MSLIIHAPHATSAHIGLWARDLFTMERFYREVLGFELAYRHSSARRPGLRCVFLTGHGLTLELMVDPDNPSPEPGGSIHLAFAPADFAAALARIEKAGVALIESPRDTGDGMREARLLDPEGRVLEIAMRVRPFAYPRIEALIFDLDGTLIDSEPNYYEADRLLLQEFGVEFTLEMKRPYVGGGNEPMMEDIKRRFRLPATKEELLEKKNRLYLDIARRHTKAFPEMDKLVRELKARGVPMAVASGSSPVVIEELLDVVGMREAFPVCVSSEDVGRGKPAPDVFLEAARRLGVEPRTTLVLEDAAAGSEAALRGGFRLAAIPTDPEPPLPFVFTMADFLYERGMADFTAASLLALLDS